MPTVPKYNREVGTNLTPTPYKHAQLNGDMFGANVNNAMANLGNSAGNFVDAMIKIKDRIDDTKLLEAKNLSSEWVQKNLLDKDNGYFYKTGKDAYGLSEGLLADYDKTMNDFIESAGLSPKNKKMAKLSLNQMRTPIMNQMYAHDYKQGVEWSNNVANDSLNNYMTDAINSRNDSGMINNSLSNALKVIEWQGELQHLDSATIEAKKKAYTQNFLESVLSAKLNEGSLSAGEFFEKNKDNFNPDKLPALIGKVKDNELNYTARETALALTSLPADKAYEKINSIQDAQTKEAVEREYNKKLREENLIKNKIENDAIDGFYDTALNKLQSGESLSYDDIPDNLDSKTKLSLMNYINSNGNPTNDDETWEQLYKKSVDDAQGFAEINLNKFRGELSESEYKSFVKRQDEIKNGNFYTQIKDDDKKIKHALNSIGLGRGKKEDVAYSEIRSLVKEFEARRGRKINDTELGNIINSLGYKDKNVYMYKQIEKGMAERVGFIRDVVNDFVYFQSQHNGQLPSDEEKMKIINKRVNSVILQQNDEWQTSLKSPYVPQKGDIWNGHVITSTYGKRTSPTKGATTDHKGIDLGYKNNEIFPAFATGKVVAVGKSNALGNYVDIRGVDGTIHRYGHANAIIVKTGDVVKAGQGIGRAGSTGISTGPHLHYAKIKNGQFINPLGADNVNIAQNQGWAF